MSSSMNKAEKFQMKQLSQNSTGTSNAVRPKLHPQQLLKVDKQGTSNSSNIEIDLCDHSIDLAKQFGNISQIND